MSSGSSVSHFFVSDDNFDSGGVRERSWKFLAKVFIGWYDCFICPYVFLFLNHSHHFSPH